MDFDAEISAKREQVSTLEREIADLESQKSSIGSGVSNASSASTPKYHAFDYMQDSVQQWEEARAQASEAVKIGACGCSSSSNSDSKSERTEAAFMASEVEQWEQRMKDAQRAAEEQDGDE